MDELVAGVQRLAGEVIVRAIVVDCGVREARRPRRLSSPPTLFSARLALSQGVAFALVMI